MVTLLTHLTALFLAIYRLMAKGISQTQMSRTNELLSYGFMYLCFGFMIIAAILLIANRFWLTQFIGYWIFRSVMELITEYAKMDLYWRFIKVFSYDLTPCLILFPVLIWLGMNYVKNRKNVDFEKELRLLEKNK